jgi:outer membrane protein OmpA-like peptidoglycan-associated protein
MAPRRRYAAQVLGIERASHRRAVGRHLNATRGYPSMEKHRMKNIGSLIVSLAIVMVCGACSSARQTPAVAQAGCTSDSECSTRGGVCIAGACQQCRSSADCGNGGACVQNRCEATEAVASVADTVTVQPTDGGASCFESVHFDFDDASLSSAVREALQRTAECLRREPGRTFVLMGHADPRGASEYNLALGQRRAQAVYAYLTALGVERSRLAASSVGSEHAEGTDEAGWARDRRVEYAGRGGAAAR